MKNLVQVEEVVPDNDCLIVTDRDLIKSSYQGYLSDESRLSFELPFAIASPRSIEQLSFVLRKSYEENRRIAISSGRTGIVGGAVSLADSVVVNLDKMVKLEGPIVKGNTAEVTVGAGVRLSQLSEHLKNVAPEWIYPVDPTEPSACFGGMVATNASGMHSLAYGPTRNWVKWIKVVLPGGEALRLTRGEKSAANNELVFQFPWGLRKLSCFNLSWPPVKATVGYKMSPDVDPIDLFIGSEGTLGVVAEVGLGLTKKNKFPLFVLQFFRNEEQAFKFVEALRRELSKFCQAIEFADECSLRIALRSPSRCNCRSLAMIRPEFVAAVFCELDAGSADCAQGIIETLNACAETLGAELNDSIAGSDYQIMADIKTFRHAVPEQINQLVSSRKKTIANLHKISTDLSVPSDKTKEMFDYYRRRLVECKLEHFIFGHIGESHLHVNIVPKNEAERVLALQLYKEFAEKAVNLGGSIAGEHGIGRIKANLLSLQYPEAEISKLKNVKRFFDPKWLLSPGVLFELRAPIKN